LGMATLPPTQFGPRTTALQARRDISLAGKVAVITGAGAGLGTETARVLALAGAQVVMAVRNVPAGETVARTLRGALEVMPLDLASVASIHALTRALLGRRERVHQLV